MKAYRQALWVNTEEKQRKCRKCGAWKPFAAYYKSRTGLLGLEGQCSDCQLKRMKEKRQQKFREIPVLPPAEG